MAAQVGDRGVEHRFERHPVAVGGGQGIDDGAHGGAQAIDQVGQRVAERPAAGHGVEHGAHRLPPRWATDLGHLFEGEHRCEPTGDGDAEQLAELGYAGGGAPVGRAPGAATAQRHHHRGRGHGGGADERAE